MKKVLRYPRDAITGRLKCSEILQFSDTLRNGEKLIAGQVEVLKRHGELPQGWEWEMRYPIVTEVQHLTFF